VIAPGRRSRPGALGRTTRVAAATDCPFCEGHESQTPPETLAIGRDGGRPDSPGWAVRVVPNKFPAIEGQEVVVHGPQHALSLADVPPGVLELVVGAWRSRAEEHRRRGAAWVMACVNEGAGAGASLEHSHSQIVPFAEVPPLVELAVSAIAAGCPLCRPVQDALLIRRNDGIRTFCPSWSRMPYETWLVPDQHLPEPPDAGALAGVLLDAVNRLRAALGHQLDWNAVLKTAPAGVSDFHWHIEITPRITVPASVELGAGIWVNVVDPEVAAAALR
jgi:UDPglucose--hexose-1-phosphate uridylyltransferase